MMKGKLNQNLSRISSATFICLKQYKSKQTLIKTKIAKFKNNSEMFQERCLLFTQICYLLLKLQLQSRTAYISKSMFINHQGILFMVYSYDHSFKDRLKKVENGNLLTSILDSYHLIFFKDSKDNKQVFQDLQFQAFHENTKQMINYFTELADKSQDYYFKNEKEHMEQEEMELTTLYSILVKLQNSLIFKQYSYPLKCSSALLVKCLAYSFQNKNSPMFNIYLELKNASETILRVMNCQVPTANFKDIFMDYGQRLNHLFRFLQAENYIKLINIKEQTPEKFKKDNEMFQIAFCSNLKKLPTCNKTPTETSSDSEEYNNASEKEKERIHRHKEYIDKLTFFKNSINFKITIHYEHKNSLFKVTVEGQSQWTLEEFYYGCFFNLWTQFNNAWCSLALQNNEEKAVNQDRHHRWELIHQQKNPIFLSMFYVGRGDNLTKDILSSIDQISMLLLLFENILKNLYKLSSSQSFEDKLSLQKIQSEGFAHSLINQLQSAFNQHSLYEKMLQQIEKR